MSQIRIKCNQKKGIIALFRFLHPGCINLISRNFPIFTYTYVQLIIICS
jgi:hypothetical protein